jgi:glycerol-3-phosphate dehydrogenase
MKSVAVIGGGINGVMTAWELAKNGHTVSLFEQKKLFSETSSATSKLIHGGLRYLEYGHFSLVYQALKDRAWWLKNAPKFVYPSRFLVPVYKGRSRSKLSLYVGVKAYQYLAMRNSLGPSQWHSCRMVLKMAPELNSTGLQGAVSYFDARMDDVAIGNWLKSQVLACGVTVKEDVAVSRIDSTGNLFLEDGQKFNFDMIVNAAGPWAKQLLDISQVSCENDLELIRGSHLIVDRKISSAFVFQNINDGRIIFALPNQNQMLVGTTEISHSLESKNQCSLQEEKYLLDAINVYFERKVSPIEVIGNYSGVRPIVKSGVKKLSAFSRETLIEKENKLINIFGGKWTTSPSLARSVANLIH